MKKGSTATFCAGVFDSPPPIAIVAFATATVPRGAVNGCGADSLGELPFAVPDGDEGSEDESTCSFARVLAAAVGFFPNTYHAPKPRSTALEAHNVSAIKKGTKRELRREEVIV